MNEHSPLGVEIALRPFLAGGRSFDYCDKFEASKIADMTDRTAHLLRDQKMVGPLTRDTFQKLILYRQPNCIPAGFSAEFLIKSGIIDPKSEPAPKKKFTEKD